MNIEDVRAYCLGKPFATEDMPFGDGYVTFRVGGKIFGCLVLEKGGLVQLKWNPDEFDQVVERYAYVEQGWHWHKRCMIQFDLDAYPVPDSVAKALIDRAYDHVFSRLPKKVRAGLVAG